MGDRQFTPKEARLLSGKSQTEVANRLGISLSTYRKLEANPERMSVGHAILFSETVGMPLNSLFFARNSSLTREQAADATA